MAKRHPVSEFADQAESTTEAKPQAKKRRRPIGLYLKNDTLAVVQQIAADNGNISIHALLVYMVSDWIRLYRAGKVKIQTETKTTLRTDI